MSIDLGIILITIGAVVWVLSFLYGIFTGNPTKTGIKVLLTSKINTTEIKDVYDEGNGAYVLDYLNSSVRYLKSDGTFTNMNFYGVNGDAVKWESHIGDVSQLKFKV